MSWDFGLPVVLGLINYTPETNMSPENNNQTVGSLIADKLHCHDATRQQGLVCNHKGQPILRERMFNIPIEEADEVPLELVAKFMQRDVNVIQTLFESEELRTQFQQVGAYYRDLPDMLIAAIAMFKIMCDLGLIQNYNPFSLVKEDDIVYRERYAFLVNALHVANKEWTTKYNKSVRKHKQSETARKTRLKRKMNQLANAKEKT